MAGDPLLSRRALMRLLAGAGAWASASWLSRSRAARADCLQPFEDEMAAHLRDFASFQTDLLDEAALRGHIRSCIARCAAYGFTLRGPIRTFLELTFLFGTAFDTDPQLPWAGEALTGRGPQMERAETLYRETLRCREALSLYASRRALAHGALLGRSLPDLDDDQLVPGHLALFRRVFPEKVTYVGREGLVALIREGAATARAAALEPRGRTLVIALMFGFGHGCLTDPLLPMIGQAVAQAQELGPDEGIAHLQATALRWLARAIAA